jgi:hypothetical protein
MPKPPTKAGYGRDYTEQVKSTLLLIATKLQDVLDEELVIVGGLAPTLLPGGGDHVGSLDVDVAVSLGIKSRERYTEVVERLRGAGFKEVTKDGKAVRWRLELDGRRARVVVEFLISAEGADEGGGLVRISDDLDALSVVGLDLAFQELVEVELDGTTPDNERARRRVRVCGPGAFVVLKARALRKRGENKDAYDLQYVVRNWPAGASDIAERIRLLLEAERAQEAVRWLREDFETVAHVGPQRAAKFL